MTLFAPFRLLKLVEDLRLLLCFHFVMGHQASGVHALPDCLIWRTEKTTCSMNSVSRNIQQYYLMNVGIIMKLETISLHENFPLFIYHWYHITFLNHQ